MSTSYSSTRYSTVPKRPHRPRVLVECCVDSLEKAEVALRGGADRLEVCSRLDAGGYTPTESVLGAITELREQRYPDRRVFAMVRPWLDGKTDFLYEEREERDALFKDLDAVLSKGGVDGLVVGALRSADGTVGIDHDLINDICTKAVLNGVEDVTFHRAFDDADDADGNRRSLIDELTGTAVTRILTSGGAGQTAKVTDGTNLATLRSYRAHAAQLERPITVMPGSGLTVENLLSVVDATGAAEVHGSFEGGSAVEAVVKLLLLDAS